LDIFFSLHIGYNSGYITPSYNRYNGVSGLGYGGTSGFGGLGNGGYNRYTGVGGYNSNLGLNEDFGGYNGGYNSGYNTLNGYPSSIQSSYSKFGSYNSPSSYSRISSYSSPIVTYPYGGIGTVGAGGGSFGGGYSNGGYIY
jgi:hypothetical protein